MRSSRHRGRTSSTSVTTRAPRGHGTLKTEFNFSRDGGAHHAGDQLRLPALVFYQKNFALEFAAKASPLAGVPSCLTVVRGNAVAVCASASEVAAVGGIDVEVFLGKGDCAAVLKKSPIFMLLEGSSLRIPFGARPIVQGLPARDPDARGLANKGEQKRGAATGCSTSLGRSSTRSRTRSPTRTRSLPSPAS